MQKEILLTLKNASVQYGGIQALNNVTINIDEGEIVALMGPNGSGKTTTLKALFGISSLSSGEVLWQGQKVDPKPYEMVSRGITYVPQGRQVFKNLTVYENLELGGYALPNKSDVKNNIEESLKFFPALREKLSVKAGLLSGGQQQMLTIARGLISDPKVLLLDEPSLGLSPKIVKEVFEKIKEINELRKIAVVIVEHSIKSVLSVSSKVFVLSQGSIAFFGNKEELESGNVLENVFLAKK
ncbi:MAG: Fe(3+)-transporting ATPase, branched-chain amino acid transport system ATP-binding protein [Candidatus Nomurabacteria bacterium]|nr:Fe(3+)-transporting ATPase, branched-chain amino acid transport system ATP-binding protein [Candidatus Nomurabacteria bacterium]